MYGIIFALHVLICILLIIVVLLQQTRGTGMSSVFGGGGGDESLFGGKGATPFFIKLTSGLAIGFFLTSLFLVLLSRRPEVKSAVEKGLETEVPATPKAPFSGEESPTMPQEGGE
jgi:preprotein translocase subunit SecG|uniref:Protein-export membrane protein SecG n=1 Tax=candidate division WOR-3 bacterium TaxID=2052148 RepID=A0A7V3RH14_UNCW3